MTQECSFPKKGTKKCYITMACDVLRTDGCVRRKQHKRKSCGRADPAISVESLQFSTVLELRAECLSQSALFVRHFAEKNHVNINPAALPFESDKMRIDRSGGDGYAPLPRRRRPENDNSAGAHGCLLVVCVVCSGSRLFTISRSVTSAHLGNKHVHGEALARRLAAVEILS